jgi:predicted outer membrane repeat protein
LGLALSLSHVAVAQTNTITVNTFAQIASGPTDCTLGDAINAANSQSTTPVNGCVGALGANTIVLSAGTYDLTQVNNSNRSAGTPDISTTITIQGAGAGTTIIQRDAGSPDFEIFFQASGMLTLNNLKLTGGEPAIGSYYSPYNSPYYSNGATLYVTSCTFDSNPGGAIVFNLSSITVDNSTFTNNTHPNNWGGALYGSEGVLAITNSLFSGNVASYHGGALYISGGTISIANSSFVGNSAGSGYYGGAIYILSGTSAAIQYCNFSGNSAGYGGAVADYIPLTGVYDENPVTGLYNSTFTNNTATSRGGALYLQGSGVNANITASTFSGNTAGDAGGAIFRDYGPVGQVTKLANTTISGNTANNWGGGMAVYGYY